MRFYQVAHFMQRELKYSQMGDKNILNIDFFFYLVQCVKTFFFWYPLVQYFKTFHPSHIHTKLFAF